LGASIAALFQVEAALPVLLFGEASVFTFLKQLAAPPAIYRSTAVGA
jgi:hypothetical protein